ncbi:hypothetical protein FOXYSP1_19611 [Fusarium oxysporum f. sp. phaseoli]
MPLVLLRDKLSQPGQAVTAGQLQTFNLPDKVSSNDENRRLGKALIEAWQTDGIFQISMTPEQRAQCKNSQTYSGYIASGEELTDGIADYSEIFTVTKDLDLDDPRVVSKWPCHGRCPWPDYEMQNPMQRYMQTLGGIGEALLQLTELGLNVPEGSLTNCTQDGWHHLRILRFPAINKTNGKGKEGRGIGSHTDYGLLVIAAADDVGGESFNPFPIYMQYRDVTGAEMYEQFYFTLYDVSANEPTSRSEASGQQEQSFSKLRVNPPTFNRKAKRAARKPPDFRDDKFRGWQTIPAMRKLHNIAVWLRNSSIHSDLWEDRVSLRLGIDNDTRWNSWYKLIDNLIRRQSQIKQFLLDYDEEINDNILNSSDWDYLERTHRFLHPFASATLWAEGKNSTLSQILTIMDSLLRHDEKNKEHYSKPETFDRRIVHSIEMGWFILDKYYTMTEDAPVYAAALLLDPSKRIRYIERHWPESWHENAITGVRTIWEEEYKTQPETGPAESVDEVSASQKRQPNEWDALLEELEVTEDLGDSMDDLEDFIKATPIKISGSPLQWWCHKDQRKTYPQLSRMAIDILSIAPESADPESAFSGGRRTLSWDRERMTCENLEKVECIGNWLREGHIQKTVHGARDITIRKSVRDYIERLIAHHRIDFEQQNKAKRGGPKKSLTLPFIRQPENQLSDKDWEVVEIFAQILSYRYYEATIKMLEGDGQIRKRKRGWTGSYGNIWDVIQGFEFLLEQLERFKDIAKDFPDTEHFRININLGWQKLNEYYEILSETPIYYGTLAWRSIRHTDGNGLNATGLIALSGLTRRKTWFTMSGVLSIGRPRCLDRNRQPLSQFPSSGRLRTIRFRNTLNGSINDPLAYWHEKRFKYLNLSRMALDFLTIQPMSAECERFFSAAGRMVNPLRHQLEAQIIGMCQVLRSWLRAGIIHELDPFFISVDEEKVNLELAQMSDEQLEGWATKWLTQVVGVQDGMGAR